MRNHFLKFLNHYNINLKDDKSFPYIRITKEAYPRIFITRQIVKDGSRYFGPYTDVYVLRRSLKAVHKIFPIRSCDFLLDKKTIQSLKVDLCLDYHIKKCDGPCQNLISEDEYDKMIKRVISFLQGRTTETEVYINDQMLQAANDTRYEDAGMYRDQLNAIKNFKDRQRKVAADFDDRDVIALSRKNNMCISVIVRIRNGRIHSREKISMNISDETDSDIIELVITQFYLNSDFIPKVLNVSDIPTNKTQLIHWLKEKRNGNIEIKLPIKGDKAREIRLAEQNAKLLLGEWIINRTKRRELIPKMIQQLQEDLQLNIPPRRIEAFDISHLGGEDTVASMVSFMDGKAKKSEYRKYKIKGVNGIDDFASIREVVVRRYRKLKDEKSSYPDLILIDGGKGQYSVARNALNECGLYDLPIIAIAKGKLRNSGNETFFHKNETYKFNRNDPSLFLLQRLRDEAHRFAISTHKAKRLRRMKKSLLDQINGIGSIRKKALLNHFGSARSVESASLDEIKSVQGIEEKVATKIYDFFHE